MRIPALDHLSALAPTVAPEAPADLLIEAVRRLAGVCDGAVTRDGQGFNGQDTKFGHRLAHLPPTMWTEAMRIEAHRMLGKYQRQLSDMGIDYARIAASAPIGPSEDEVREARQDARRRLAAAQSLQARLEARPDGEIIVLSFPYQADAVDLVKGLPGRRWNPDARHWQVPAEPAIARSIMGIASRFGWNVEPAIALLAARAGSAPAPAAPPARTIQLEMGTLAIRWPYGDPDFQSLKNEVKAIPGRAWDGAAKCWRAPTSPAAAAAVASLAERHGFDVAPRAQEAIDAAAGDAILRAEASRALDATLEIDTLALTLHPFQRAGVAYALDTGRCFIADEMGLGKTCQALATVEAKGAFPALFIVPASLRRNWQREAQKWLPHRTSLVVTGTTPRADYAADIVIINYDILPHHVEELLTEGFRAVVLDESHYAKNAKAARTKAVLQLADGPEVKLCLSGTPLPNKPIELLPQLQFLGRLNDLGGRRDFYHRYCQDYVHPLTLTQLHEQLRQTCYIRRTKKDVMPELPAVQPMAVDADLAGRARREIDGAMGELVGAALEMTAAEEATDRNVARGSAMGALATLRRLVGIAKVPAAIDWVKEFHANGGGKLVVFAHHVDVQNAIAEAFPGCARIVAGMDSGAVLSEVDRFQTDEHCNLIVVSLMAGSVGLTLTAASHMLVVELPWVPKDLSQAHGRCYGRVNDAHGLNAYHLLAPGTLDERVAEILERKLQTTTAVQDGQVLDEVEASKSIVGELLEMILAELDSNQPAL